MTSWQTSFYNTRVNLFFKYELEASKRIKNLFNVQILNFNNDNKYDFIDSNNIKYEVKYDGNSLKSGNFKHCSSAFICFLIRCNYINSPIIGNPSQLFV